MIYLCCDNEKTGEILSRKFSSEAIRFTVLLYYKSYGTSFDFAQYYIQFDEELNTETAIIMRYNQTIYILTKSECDVSELSSFVSGFADSEVIYDGGAGPLQIDCKSENIGAVMSRKGTDDSVQNTAVTLINEPKLVTNLVGENMSENVKTDFFLNTAHQMRHNLLKVYGVMLDKKLVSTASVFDADSEQSLIHFVYTGEHFRGNGYSRQILQAICSDISVDYLLLCEEHNINFYEKCGFTLSDSWVYYRL